MANHYDGSTLLDISLKREGIPIVGVSQRGDVLTIQYDPSATPQQQVDGDAIAAALDLNAEAALAADIHADEEIDRLNEVSALVEVIAPLVGKTEAELISDMKVVLRRLRRADLEDLEP
tara:strand:- start:34 stop:390 length:357 start_codon:yes stop_codon:yes gene_type:complete